MLSVKALLGNRHVDTTLNYARPYDETAAKQFLHARVPGRSFRSSFTTLGESINCADAQNNAGTWVLGQCIALNNASQLTEVEYLAATNGYLKLWLQDALVDPVNLENDTCAVTGMNRDAMWFIPTGTSGTVYFGTFEKRRGGYIGSLAIAAPLLAQKEPVSQYNASFQPAA